MIFGVLGTFYIAPPMHVFYTYILPSLVPQTVGISAGVIAAKKIMIDQLLFAPIVTLGFFPVFSVLNGGTIADGIEQMREKYF